MPALTPSTETAPAQSQSLSSNDTKVTLDNVNAWDDAFKLAKGDANPPAEKEDEKKEQEEETPITDKGATEEKEKEAEEEAATEEEGDEKKGGTRDYSQFPEEDVPFLKQMSRQAFEHFSKRLTGLSSELAEKTSALNEIKAGKTLPDDWYNDPAAAEASPDYKAIKSEFEKAQSETHRLGDLLLAVKNGELKYNPATNTFVPNEDGDAVDERMVQHLSDLRLQEFEKQKDLAAKGNTLIENFSSIYKQAESSIVQTMEKLMPWMKDPKSEDQAHFKKLMDVWPKVFRNHPAARFAAAIGVEFVKMKTALNVANKKLAAKGSVQEAQRRAGPNPSGRNGKADKSERKYTLEELEEEK